MFFFGLKPIFQSDAPAQISLGEFRKIFRNLKKMKIRFTYAG